MSSNEDQILDQMRRCLRAQKRILSPAKWSLPDKHKASRITLGLECDEPEITGAELHLRCSIVLMDADVSAQLCIALPDRTYNIERIDWRPRNPHTNRVGPPEYRGLTLDTSAHDFEVNASLGLKEMQSRNLPVVVPLVPEPLTFNELITTVRVRFSIDDMSMIPVPEWSPELI